jgi:N-acetylglucosaminyl-diphospho-decaprenol L-rhamnosyltransferase
MYDLQISIVTFNNGDHILDCLQSILANPAITEDMVYLLDNCSSDQTTEIVSNQFSQINLINSHENVGFAAGHNHIFQQSKSELILVVNPDSTISNNLIPVLHSTLQSFEELALVAPKAVYPDNTPQVNFWLISSYSFGQ